MIIDANTKIAAILKTHPDALEEIISINPKFEKLRNPIMRKLMAGRTSLSMASKIAGCAVTDFFQKLEPLGFQIATAGQVEKAADKAIPSFVQNLKPEDVTVLDVRPLIENGKDPLSTIMEAVNQLQASKTLKIINSFEPTPLIHLLEKKGFRYYIDKVSEELIATYFFRSGSDSYSEVEKVQTKEADWKDIKNKYSSNLKYLDVRQLPMPLPMHTILENLEHLDPKEALYVYHKRIPVFLLPELRERNFDYRISEIDEGEVHLLIFHQ